MSENYRDQVQRISLLEAQDFCREQDGLEPGSTSVMVLAAAKQADAIKSWQEQYYAEPWHHEQFETLKDFIEYTAIIEGADEELEPARFYDVLNGIESAEMIVGVLDGQDLLSDEVFVETEDPRRTVLNGMVHDFTELTGYERDDLRSLDVLIEFAAYYQTKLETITAESGTIELVTAARNELVGLLNSRVGTRLLGRDIVAKITPIIETVPIVVAGPLDSLAGAQAGSDTLGLYTLQSMHVQIDPFTNANNLKNYGGVQSVADRTKSTVFHELIHAPTAGWQNRVTSTLHGFGETEEFINLRYSKLWPTFYTEGMTEKLSGYFFAHAEHDADAETITVHNRYDRWRKDFSSDPPQILKTQKAMKVCAQRYEAYREYRLAIDVLFAKLDWDAAGLTKRQAETLAARAFFDMPDDTSRNMDNCQYVRSFNTALTKAGHQGILRRVSNLAEVVGIHRTLDVLESEQFDPHDKHSIPSVGGARFITSIMTQRPEAITTIRNAYEKAKQSGYRSEDELERYKTEATKVARALDTKKILVNGLHAVIQSRYGHRPRFLNAEKRLLQAILGNQLPSKWEQPDDSNEEYRLAISSLNMWFRFTKPKLQTRTGKILDKQK